MTTQPYPLKPKQPYDVLREVIYEIKMLAATPTQPVDNEFAKIALLESRLLHTRNLIDFFERSQRTTRRTANGRVENDDVLAQDYGFLPRTVGLSQRDKERLNKALAHIAYERVEYRSQNQMDWPLKTTLLPILVPCEEFLQYLIDKFLRKEDDKAKEELTRLLADIRMLMDAIRQLPNGG